MFQLFINFRKRNRIPKRFKNTAKFDTNAERKVAMVYDVYITSF